MTDAACDTHEAARKLRVALEQVGDALSGARLDDLLAAESAVMGAIETMPDEMPAGRAARLALRRELDRARAALARCRRFGVSLGAFMRASLEAQGAAGGYDRQGLERATDPAHALDTRV